MNKRRKKGFSQVKKKRCHGVPPFGNKGCMNPDVSNTTIFVCSEKRGDRAARSFG